MDGVMVLPLQALPRLRLLETEAEEPKVDSNAWPARFSVLFPAIDALDLACHARDPETAPFGRDAEFAAELTLLSAMESIDDCAERLVDLLVSNLDDGDGTATLEVRLLREGHMRLDELSGRLGLSHDDLAAAICLSALLRVNDRQAGE